MDLTLRYVKCKIAMLPNPTAVGLRAGKLNLLDRYVRRVVSSPDVWLTALSLLSTMAFLVADRGRPQRYRASARGRIWASWNTLLYYAP